jgi:hypothetical protein
MWLLSEGLDIEAAFASTKLAPQWREPRQVDAARTKNKAIRPFN